MDTSASQVLPGEYDALWSGCGIIPLAGWSNLLITGQDRQTFLNNFCSNEVKHLASGERCEAFFLNVKGKILAHALIAWREDALQLVVPSNLSATLLAHLDRYIIREKVELRDISAERPLVLLSGEATAFREVLRQLFPEALVPFPATGSAELPGGDVVNFMAWFEAGAWQGTILDVAESRRAYLCDELVAAGAIPCGMAAFDLRRIEAGLPIGGVDFDESNLAQEVDRNDEAISFKKGCYLGQETVARIDALGHVNQTLVGLKWAGREVPTAGSEVYRDGEVVGRVTSSAFSPRANGAVALAMVRRGSNGAGTRLDAGGFPCEVVSAPIIR